VAEHSPTGLDATTPWVRRWLRAEGIAANVVHNWATAGVVLGLGLLLSAPGLVLAGVLLVAHVGMDRGFGYGLKYPTAFQDTHLGRIGRRR